MNYRPVDMRPIDDERLSNNRLVVSYLMLRKSVGLLGMLLPIVLIIGGALIFKRGIQNTVSDYYYTGMRNVFVGTLCAMGVFFFSYKGYGKRDNLAANIAAVCVIGVALFPTTPENPTALTSTIGTIHVVFATTYFATLAYFSLFLFTKSDPTVPATRMKIQRNRVYRVSGYLIVWALVAIAIYNLFPSGLAARLEALDPIFWLESVAVIAFGISWFVKGEGILEDENK